MEQVGLKSPAAGIIVLKACPDATYGYMVLSLVDRKGFDLPKGQLEQFETPLVGALRETAEECNISDLDFKWGLVTTRCNNVTLYIAETYEEPTITPNPETGKCEHHQACWLDLDVASNVLREYLQPSIPWAMKVIGR